MSRRPYLQRQRQYRTGSTGHTLRGPAPAVRSSVDEDFQTRTHQIARQFRHLQCLQWELDPVGKRWIWTAVAYTLRNYGRPPLQIQHAVRILIDRVELRNQGFLLLCRNHSNTGDNDCSANEQLQSQGFT